MGIIKKTMTTSEVVNIFKSLQEFNKKDICMPGVFSWTLEDNMESFEKINSKFLKFRQQIDQEFVDKNKVDLDTNKINPEFLYEYRTKLSEFLNIENNLEICTVPYSVIDGVSLSLKDIQAIKFMIEREK